MKKIFVILFLVSFVFSGCSASGDNSIQDQNTDGTGSDGELSPGDQNSGGSEPDPDPTLPPAEQCTTGEEHPIAVNMADTYSELTTYEEIIGWFCEGALFEDILNALTTEELSGVDAEVPLQMLADGKTWNEIWLELGITQE